MIELIRLNGDSFNLNALLIEQVESLPDSTTITLNNGKKLVVKNKKSEIVQKVTSFYQTIGLQLHVKAGDGNE
nr:flagellar FlbD family protein [Oceanobacillus sp. Castelsardo]